jgi:hypothetical protein
MRVDDLRSGIDHSFASRYVLGSTMKLLGGRSRGRWTLADRDLGTARYEEVLFRPGLVLLVDESGVPHVLSARLSLGVPIWWKTGM